jgi:hypothetical protein
MGRFEGSDRDGRWFVAQMIVNEGDRRPLVAQSARLAGTPQPKTNDLLLGSGVGAAAITILTGLSGIGLLGGVAIGAAAAVAEAPQIVVIEPGQIIEVEIVDWDGAGR